VRVAMIKWRKKYSAQGDLFQEVNVITLGILPTETISGLKKALNQEFSLRLIPFVQAEKEQDYLEFQRNKSPHLEQISLGEAGCLLAHRKAWKIAQSSKCQLSLILEDDATLTRYGSRQIKNLIEDFLKSGVNLLHLGHPLKHPLLPTPQRLLSLSPRLALKAFYESCLLKLSHPQFVLRSFPPSSHAYLIRREFAEALYSIPIRFEVPVDIGFGAMAQVKQHRVARVRTPLFLQSGRPSLIRKTTNFPQLSKK
jgi:GR25 family glycosyltransferase involved in LPS biosynthesis